MLAETVAQAFNLKIQSVKTRGIALLGRFNIHHERFRKRDVGNLENISNFPYSS